MNRKKKKKRRHDEDEEEAGPRDGWVNVDSLEDFAGPVFIVTSDRSKCLAVFGEGESAKLSLQRVTPREEGELEPDQVVEVFLAQPVASNTVALKTNMSRCLSSDKFGLVSIQGEAVGPQEEWIPVFREDGVAFQSAVHEKFLKAETATGVLRADSETVGFCEVFTVRCQAARKYAAKTKKVPEKKAPEELEVEYL